MIGALLLAALALAEEPEKSPLSDLHATLHGDTKLFFFASFPYDVPIPEEVVVPGALFPEDPVGQGIFDFRAKLEVRWQDWLKLDVHHAITMQNVGLQVTGPFGAGFGASVPEAIDLTWEAYPDADGFSFVGRTDRLMLTAIQGPVTVTLGRQPISFGQGRLFTPLDLVGPFNPAVVDQEYKPGYDAARFDAYFGLSGMVTVVGAYAGDWDRQGLVGVAYGQATVGVTDIGLFLGEVQADHVAGLSVASAIGQVGVYGDAAVTVPDTGDPFVRAVAGAMYRPTGTTTVSGELYLQTLGAANPDGYLALAGSDRFMRGQLWLLGRYYAGLSISQEITPTLIASGAVVANLGEYRPSFLAPVSLSWSVSGNADLIVGAFLGGGERPVVTAGPQNFPELHLDSEFGLYPATAYAEMKAYF